MSIWKLGDLIVWPMCINALKSLMVHSNLVAPSSARKLSPLTTLGATATFESVLILDDILCNRIVEID